MSRTHGRRLGTAALAALGMFAGTGLVTAVPAQATPLPAAETITQAAWRDNRILRPAQGETVSGEVTIGASGGRYGTRAFFVDGVEIGRTSEWTDIDITHEYLWDWDTRTVPNGQHVITSGAVEDGLVVHYSEPVTVTVAN